MTQEKAPSMRGPEGRSPNVSPARKGWESTPKNDLSAVGAALSLGRLPPVSLHAKPSGLSTCNQCCRRVEGPAVSLNDSPKPAQKIQPSPAWQ
jgi:hypothetical protein